MYSEPKNNRSCCGNLLKIDSQMPSPSTLRDGPIRGTSRMYCPPLLWRCLGTSTSIVTRYLSRKKRFCQGISTGIGSVKGNLTLAVYTHNMNIPDIAYWNALHIISDLGCKDFRLLVGRFGTGRAAFEASLQDFSSLPLSRAFRGKLPLRGTVDPMREYKKMHRAGVTCITLCDQVYPAGLREIASPPPLLYFRGDIQLTARPCFAIVGSRRATNYGILQTNKFAREVADAGFVIVSGMAFGIDSYAHTAALEFDKKTIAVLGSGVDQGAMYPREHEKLGEKIARDGLVVSEHPVGYHPEKGDFPRRNRIISGLSLGVFITEGKEKSGALITARCALEQGKEVFALPGDITRATSRGPNNLLMRGATPVQTLDDILFEFRERADIQQALASCKPEVNDPILHILSESPASADTISHALGLEISAVQSQLSEFEITQQVIKRDGLYYSGAT